MKLKKKLLSLIGVAVMVCMMSNAALASSTGLVADITSKKVFAEFGYGTKGALKVKIAYTEKHPQTGHVYSSSCQASVTDGTYVPVSKKVDTGYKFTKMTAYGYVGGTKKVTAGPLKP